MMVQRMIRKVSESICKDIASQDTRFRYIYQENGKSKKCL